MRMRSRVIAFCLVVLSVSVHTAVADTASTGFFSKPFLLGAHRGGADLWPENTLTAFQLAAARFPGILLETDARLTADGHVILMHDGTVDRTTDGSGAIADLTLEEIRRLDAGYRFTSDGGATYPYRGKGIQVPTLGEALAALSDSHFLVEFKGEPALADAAIGAIRDANAMDRVLIASFKPETMARVRELAPGLPACYDFMDGAALLTALRGEGWDSYEPANEVLSLDEDMLPQFKITPEELQRIREKGIKVQLHTINELSRIENTLALGVDSILTDRPDLLAEALAKRESGTTSQPADPPQNPVESGQ
jgi:glycerophosphoryl diester phosphodiesterase